MATTESETTATTVELTMGEGINRALAEALEREPEMMLLGQDIGAYGGTFGVTRGLFDRYGHDTVRDAPLCESATVGFAIGLAVSGVRSVVELEFFDFIGVAMDQVFNQAAKLHYFTGGRLQVPLVIRVPIVARMGMGPQHSQSLESWFMHIPGLKIAMPADAADGYGLMRTALLDTNPVLFIENVRLYGRRGTVDLSAEPIPFGQARIVREGTDVTVVALSALVHEAVAAAEELAGRGHLGRGRRPAHAQPARPGLDRRVGQEDAAPGRRARRAQALRRRRGDRGAGRRAGLRLPGRAGRARVRPRRAGAVRPAADRGVPDGRRHRGGRRALARAERVMGDLLLPKLSISMEEGRLVRWLVESGAEVSEGEPVAIVETDKAEVEVEAPESGPLEILVAEGEIVPVESTIGRIGAAAHRRRPPTAPPAAAPSGNGEAPRHGGITAADLTAGSPPAGSFAAVAGAGARPARRAAAESGPPRPSRAAAAPADGTGRRFASPAARRVARELGVDIAEVRGRGPGGRIVAADVEEHAAAARPAAAATVAEPASRRLPDGAAGARRAPGRRRPLGRGAAPGGRQRARPRLADHPARQRGRRARRRGPRRRTPGREPRAGEGHLHRPAAARARAGAARRARARRHHRRRRARSSRRRASTSTSRSPPPTASSRRSSPTSTSLGLAAIARERSRVVEAARGGQLDGRDLAPGACTLSNLGAYPVDFFTPVLSGPQVALVATGRIAERVVAQDGLIGVRPRMWANVCLDHRAADGEAGGRLLAALERRIAELPTSI